ncbi:hypothetical protein DPMN_104705 [Dreissena polymorpha]|uniref:EGF-like domain-containing protein n=1 Tax=Dreissena polymorpha TaxID=45954 RepID=A0A9D4K347_DREPO|nr:hypothetical protein DPMN_104705 [Dreissena polymorpha]
MTLSEVDECQTVPCKNGGTCSDLLNDFNHMCTSEWEAKDCGKSTYMCVIYFWSSNE